MPPEKDTFLGGWTMLALKTTDVKNNFKAVCARVFNGETVMLSCPKNQNVVMLSEKEYNICGIIYPLCA